MNVEANFDENQVPDFQLPDSLVCADGTPVKNPETWWRVRRSEILSLFEHEMYGMMPGRPESMHFGPCDMARDALHGAASRKQVTIYFTTKPDGPKLNLLMYQPNQGEKPFPLFLSLNFGGNHAINTDPGIQLSDAWFPEGFPGIINHQATNASRGVDASRWPIEHILQHGYALATAY